MSPRDPSLPMGFIYMSACLHAHMQNRNFCYPIRVRPWRTDFSPSPNVVTPQALFLPHQPPWLPFPAQPSRASVVWPLPASPAQTPVDLQATVSSGQAFVLFFFFINLFIYLSIFGCVGSSLLHTGFLWLRQAGATLHCGVWASHWGGFSCCGARPLGAQASVVVARGLSSCGTWAQ